MLDYYIVPLLDLFRLYTTQKIQQQTVNSISIMTPPPAAAIMIIIIISSLLPPLSAGVPVYLYVQL